MTFDEYQAGMRRTWDPNLTHDQRLTLWSLGLCGEAGESVEDVKKRVFHDKPINREKVKLELGDALFYLTSLAEDLGIALSEIAEANTEKRAKRFPTGWVAGGGVR